MSKHLADSNTHRRQRDPAPEVGRDQAAARAREDPSTELPAPSAPEPDTGPEPGTPPRRNVLLEIEAALRADAVYQHALAELAGR